jgi:DNA polymerase I
MVHYVTKQSVAVQSDFWKVTSGLSSVVDYCKSLKEVCIDFETTGLDFLEDRPVLLAIGDRNNQYVINLLEYSLEPLREILESVDIVKVAHNVKFEYLFFKKHYNIELEHVFDTMLTSNIITCGAPDTVRHNLEAVVMRYLRKKISKREQTSFIGKKSLVFRESQILYAAEDIAVLGPLKEVLSSKAEERKLQNVVYLENEAVLAFADIEFNGMYLNSQKWLILAEQAEKRKYELQKNLERLLQSYECFRGVCQRGVQLDLFDPNALCDFVNWDSPSQTVKVFQCLLPSIIDTEERTLLNIVYHEEFTVLVSQHSKLTQEQIKEFVGLYLEFKEASKAAGAYGRDFLRHIRSDGKIHTSIKQILKTGRVSSKEPNLQQIPGKNEYRNCFEAPPGYRYVSSDFSSQELAVIAYGSQDPVFIEALEKGRDLHSVAAVVVYGDAWQKAAEPDCAFYAEDDKGQIQYKKCECPKHIKMRTAVKTINFGLAYGMTHYKLADTLGIPPMEARELIKTYFLKFPRIKIFLEELANFAASNGYCVTYPPYMRKRFNPDFEKCKYDLGMMGAWERQGKNTPIQGSSADMTKEALVRIRKTIKRHKLPVFLVCQVHDQVDTIAHESIAEKWAEKLTELMCKAAQTIIPTGLLKAETTISKMWQK